MKIEHEYSGADWIGSTRRSWLKKGQELKPMSNIGRAAADILGFVWAGIYHLDDASLCKVDWSNSSWIEILLPSDSLATYDGNRLTLLVLCAHECAVRVEIEACNHQYIRAMFHPRTRTGTISQRHPTIEQAIAAFRERFKVTE